MNIGDLHTLGSKLFKAIGSQRLRPFASQHLGKGAAGDNTFPIDRQAEDIIIDFLGSLNEPISVISEEAGYKDIGGGGSLKALIDPIDGSKNAITGIPFYCSSIAIIEGNRIGDVIMSLVVNLLTGDCFTASKGRGAFFNREPISTQKDESFYMLAYEAQSPKNDMPKIMNLLSAFRRTRCLGATALDMAYLAYGAVSVFVTPAPSRTFDFAGGCLLIKEAGGIVSDISGNPIEDIEIGIGHSRPIIASGNLGIHERVLKLLNPS